MFGVVIFFGSGLKKATIRLSVLILLSFLVSATTERIKLYHVGVAMKALVQMEEIGIPQSARECQALREALESYKLNSKFADLYSERGGFFQPTAYEVFQNFEKRICSMRERRNRETKK